MAMGKKAAIPIFLSLAGLIAGIYCNPFARLFDAGPFSGQVLDTQTGKPIPGAFVGFNWDGTSWIAGHSRLHSVLVQTDAQGRYELPWQGARIDSTGWHSVSWHEEVWAGGYMLSHAVAGSHSSNNHGVQVLLQRALSVMDALAGSQRLDLASYCCKENTPWDKMSASRDARREANRGARQALAVALYRDSYHWICEGDLPVEALTSRYVETPRVNLSAYLIEYDRFEYEARTNAVAKDKWQRFDQKTESINLKNAKVWDPASLRELCQLSRYAPALSGTDPGDG